MLRRQNIHRQHYLFVFGCILSIVLLFSGCVGGCYVLSNVNMSEGYRDGTVRKLSCTGLVWKTWEIEMLGDGMRVVGGENTGRVYLETFQYTVTDPAVVSELEKIPPGQKVRLHYRKQGAAWVSRGETPYFVTRVELLKE